MGSRVSNDVRGKEGLNQKYRSSNSPTLTQKNIRGGGTGKGGERKKKLADTLLVRDIPRGSKKQRDQIFSPQRDRLTILTAKTVTGKRTTHVCQSGINGGAKRHAGSFGKVR